MMGKSSENFDSLKIFFTGVGGQGTLLATHLVGEAALEEGLPVMLSEIHGMAQRGGVVESTAVLGDVKSPIITNGEADVMMAFEPVEAWRALDRCNPNTCLLANTVPVIPFTVATGKAKYPKVEDILSALKAKLGCLLALDAVDVARQAGNSRASNVVMVGVLAGTGILPISDASWQAALANTVPPKLLDINKKAFEMGFNEGQKTDW